MEEEEERNPEAEARLAKAAKKEKQTEQTAQALRNAANVVGLSPEVAGRVANAIKIGDKVTGGKLTRGAARVVNKVPLGKTAGKVLGNKVASTATSVAAKSASASSGTKTPNAKSSAPKKTNTGSVIPTSDSKSKSTSSFDSSSLSVLIGDVTPLKLIAIIGGFALFLFVAIFAAIFSAINNDEENMTALAVANVASAYAIDPIYGGVVGIVTVTPGLQNATLVTNIANILNNKVDFNIFNKPFNKKEGDEISGERNSSKFGDYLKSLEGKVHDKFLTAIYNIGGYFGNVTSSCQTGDCNESDEMKFYQKITDISFRYKKLYGIELDWPLITATLMINGDDKTEIFKDNISSYTVREVNNLKSTMSLDWDYIYPDPNKEEATYDMQLLAKNMVTKKTVQTCSLNNKVNTTKELVDVEDSKINDEKASYDSATDKTKVSLEYYLPCKQGEAYAIKNTYTLDKDKYDEYLDEFLEKKYYLKGTSNSSNEEYSTIPYGHDLASTMVNVAAREIDTPNKDKFINLDGCGCPGGWCASFVSWVTQNTEYNGIKLYPDVIKIKTPSPEKYMKYFYESNDPNIHFHYNGYASRWASYGPKYDPKPGDLIFFNWYGTWSGNFVEIVPGSGKTSHIGIVKSVDGNNIYTIEGNTSNSQVKQKTRYLNSNDVIGFGSWY